MADHPDHEEELAPAAVNDESSGSLFTQSQAIEVDTNTNTSDDKDSAFGSESESTTSTSILSSIRDYEYSNGRRYHAYKKGAYLLPNDEMEQERLDMLHHVFLLALDGRLFISPLHDPQRIFDVGTGTGLWAIDVADEYPSAQVIGTDLSPIQPGWVPPNVQFYIEDAETEWIYDPDDSFDLIHTRVIGGSIGDWDKFVRQAYTHLKPGGWLELHEPQSWITADDDSMARCEYTIQFQSKCVEAAQKFGKDINLAPTHKQRLIDAGFVDVQENIIKIPIGSWPKDPRLKEMGRFWLEHMVAGIEVYSLGFIGKVLGWGEAECRVLAAKVGTELRDRKNHLYVNCHIIRGCLAHPSHGPSDDFAGSHGMLNQDSVVRRNLNSKVTAISGSLATELISVTGVSGYDTETIVDSTCRQGVNGKNLLKNTFDLYRGSVAVEALPALHSFKCLLHHATVGLSLMSKGGNIGVMVSIFVDIHASKTESSTGKKAYLI
ncbi:hypothetical protein UA08_06948 [Talaromyces atroroseus]|uniref:Secondary metabolism regulator LAE1 n=1 Tax=Talaromyces atroroseus TaxID=1441469 RepID=A0A225AHK1_TALAT|nr:hypothetical protein UA08_06948 [Talaromyces atroroseus]OKL57674.1 hypothetical protein UA08_06948 [Talaromyces atroroseus]